MIGFAALLLALPLPPAAPAQDDTAKAIEALKTEDAAQRRVALEGLEKRGASALPAVLRALEGASPEPPERLAGLLRQLSAKSWKDRDEAMQSLVRLGRSAKGGLEAVPAEGDPEVVWRVKAVLSEIQDRSGHEELLEELRNAALCEFLGEAGDPRGVAPLLKILTAPGAADARPELKLHAADALGKLAAGLEKGQAEDAADRVLALLEKTPSPIQKSLLIRVLGRLRSPATVRPLSALLADRSEKNLHLKRACLAALAQTGDASALRAVIETLGSSDPYLRQSAAQALGEASGAPTGFDPRGGAEENRESVHRIREWWEKKFKRSWTD
ncbi:MAG TPA: HEAT repeat domain-containing protein [Planctomycetota bacterium]|nr:HEAT repeat domain-containing protein [Planctomycetota bacterium]